MTAAEKRPTMLRLPDEIYEKIRYLASVERRSMNMEIEYVLAQYIADYEKRNGSIQLPEDAEEE